MKKESDLKTTTLEKPRSLEQQRRAGSLFGAYPVSVTVRQGADLIGPVLDVVPDAETGLEVDPSRR